MWNARIEGTVVIQFVVELDGSLSNFIVLRDIGGGSAEEALRLVKAMPLWNPAINNNKPVRAYHLIPITFQIGKKR